MIVLTWNFLIPYKYIEKFFFTKKAPQEKEKEKNAAASVRFVVKKEFQKMFLLDKDAW
jgi:hypothetical protein